MDTATASKIAALEAEVVRLNAELHGERDDHANTTRALHHISKWVHGEDFRAEYPTATAMRQALHAARADAKCLADEVRAWREADKKHDLIEVVRVEGEVWESMVLQAVGHATDNAGALERNR